MSGRSDKRFCCDSCRSNWHNSKAHENDRPVRQINGILRRNRNILQHYYETGRRHIGKHELNGTAFNPEFYTSRTGWLVARRYCCYDIYYRALPGGSIYLLKAQKLMGEAED